MSVVNSYYAIGNIIVTSVPFPARLEIAMLPLCCSIICLAMERPSPEPDASFFERFYKASHSRNDASGSGLGLSIARQIIEQHKGSITVSSLTGKGTEVTIVLPVA